MRHKRKSSVVSNASFKGSSESVGGHPELLRPEEAAKFIGVAGAGVLAVWRSTERYDLAYYKVGRKVLYDVNDLLAFLESRKVRRTEALAG